MVRKNPIGQNDCGNGELKEESLYCRKCNRSYEPKYKGRDEMSLDYEPKKIICVDCGEEVYLESFMDSRTCRCVDCNLIYQRERNAKKNKEYRERNRIKS